LYLILRARQALERDNSLPWLLLATALPSVLMGAMEQATLLGFLVLTSGLCLASARCSERPAPQVRLAAA